MKKDNLNPNIKNKEMIYHHSFFNFTLVFCIRNAQENYKEKELNEMHQMMVYGDNVTLLGANVYAANMNIETLIEAANRVGCKQTQKITKYSSCHVTKTQNKIIISR
jgi:hypothetical protein